MKDVYQHCSEKHLHRDLSEFDFRYSNRGALGANDTARTDAAIRGIVGSVSSNKQLTEGPKPFGSTPKPKATN